MFDLQAFLKLIVSNALSKKSVMTIFLASLTVMTVSLIASFFPVVAIKLNVVPAYVLALCLFCFYFLVVDKLEAKKITRKKIRKKRNRLMRSQNKKHYGISTKKNV
ncbi:MAG: hypothetical protein KAI50_04640 [Desulfobacterales bacterium]|nr:hypothetical protein [Desulfobacterales bacterium]